MNIYDDCSFWHLLALLSPLLCTGVVLLILARGNLALRQWGFLSPMCQLMFTEAWGWITGFHNPLPVQWSKGKKIILFVSTVVSFMGNFPTASLTLQPGIEVEREREIKEEISREMSTLKCSASLETAAWFGGKASLFVFHLSCPPSFMCFNQPCISIYESNISQEMQIMSAVL